MKLHGRLNNRNTFYREPIIIVKCLAIYRKLYVNYKLSYKQFKIIRILINSKHKIRLNIQALGSQSFKFRIN